MKVHHNLKVLVMDRALVSVQLDSRETNAKSSATVTGTLVRRN